MARNSLNNKKFNSMAKSSIMDKIMEKELEFELKKLELARRQYETFHTGERKKLIKRFAHRLMISSSHDLASKLEKLHQEDEQNHAKKKVLLPAIVPVQPVNILENTSYDSFAYSNSDNEGMMSPVRSYDNFQELKPKKNVVFNSEVIEREIPDKDNTNVYLYEHQNEPEVEIKNRNVIMAKIALIKRETSFVLPDINENKKKTPKSTKEFLDSLNEEDSGFYICTNSKGKPLCDGYDNYCILPQAIVKKKDSESNEPVGFINPFERLPITPNPQVRVQPLAASVNRSSSKTSTQLSRSSSSVVRNSRAENASKTSRLKSTHVSFMEPKSRHNSAFLFKQLLLVKRKEEEEKICNLQLKAQNIRSLTLKQINIY